VAPGAEIFFGAPKPKLESKKKKQILKLKSKKKLEKKNSFET